MNDSFRTSVFMQYQPETIACACIFLAARKLEIALPNQPQWFELFDVEEDELKDISMKILRLYTRQKVNILANNSTVQPYPIMQSQSLHIKK